MKKMLLLIVVVAMSSVLIAAKEPAKWTTVVTTNSFNQITRKAISGTNTVVLVWNDYRVPFALRTKWETMSDEQKAGLAAAMTTDLRTKGDQPETPVYPNRRCLRTDSVVTSETRTIQVR